MCVCVCVCVCERESERVCMFLNVRLYTCMVCVCELVCVSLMNLSVACVYVLSTSPAFHAIS